MSSNQNEHKDRAIALDRALRYAVLFRKENFKTIQDLLKGHTDPQKNPVTKDTLKNATTNTGLTDDDFGWLANYLKHHAEFKYTDGNDNKPASTPW